MALHPDDLAALGIGAQPAQQYGQLPAAPQLDLSALLGTDLPQAPAAPEAPAVPDRFVGNNEVLDHLATVIKASASGALQTPKGLVKAGETVKVNDDGLTPAERAGGVAVRGQALLDSGEVDANRMSSNAQLYEEKAAALRAQADTEDERRVAAEEENNQRQTRIREHQEYLAEQRDEPINPNRYVENMSMFGKAAAIISAFAYGYLNPRGQGVAPIVTQLQQMASEDVRAQIANNAEGRARRGDQIALYERKYGDLTLVSKKLEADKLQTLGKRAMAEADESKSAEAKAAAEDLGSKLLIQAATINKSVEEAYSAQPVERTTTYKPGAGKGDPAVNAKKAADTAKALEEIGYSPEQIGTFLRGQGLQAPTGQSAAEIKRRAEDDKRAALSPEEKKDLRDRMDGLAESVAAAAELDKAVGFKRNAKGEIEASGEELGKAIPGATQQVLSHATNSLPWGMSKGANAMVGQMRDEEAKTLERMRDTIVFGQAKADGQGALSEGDREVYRMKIPIDSPLSLMKASTEQLKARRQKYQNLVGQYGKGNVDAELRKRGINPLDMGED